MKLISLNTWGGKVFEPLIEFIQSQADDTDIFCLQEIYDTNSNVKQYKNIIRANLLDELKNILKDFQVFYFPTLFGFDDEAKKVNFDLSYGIAIFLKNHIKIADYKNYFIYKPKSLYFLKKDFSNLATPLHHVQISINGKNFHIFNFHGSAYPPDKLDSDNRLREAKRVWSILNRTMGAKILVGDFNLLPNTYLIKTLEKDFRNLIKEFNIKRTRSNLSPYFKSSDFQKFADYTFVSKGIEVKNFQVPNIQISDHLPIILEFS
ncbi:endonuclease/exonuclease/phosphatase family protein [Candidatus Daviesbacteria bacterium]|nr:endonuclease/exonuclease/phosphatase family protein [Candidatus Daviesbacteria bacterium]